MTQPDPTTAQLEARVTALEEQLAWLQHTVSALDEVVRALGADNQRLRSELGELSDQIAAAGELATQGVPTLLDERPPHY
ncbi:MAG: SlyX family protein [Deltaproteobacteria bacterium]|nr:SlyX family protein [Deltaproteobacteria bacterium]